MLIADVVVPRGGKKVRLRSALLRLLRKMRIRTREITADHDNASSFRLFVYFSSFATAASVGCVPTEGGLEIFEDNAGAFYSQKRQTLSLG